MLHLVGGARKFGEKVTCDIVIPESEEGAKVKSAILFYDFATGWLELIPLSDRSTESIEAAIRRFTNPKTIKYLACDREGGILKAANQLHIDTDPSLPGRPETNGTIERQVGVVARGTRALLSASGLPLAFWTFAASTSCHLKTPKKGII